MNQTKQQHYTDIAKQIEAIVAGETDMIANMANISALLYWQLDRVNWAGFYMYKDHQLVLGPFHGQPACIRIPIGKGVCGTAVSENTVMLVEDVHQFSGHIACDAASNSEIVLPIRFKDKIIAVLDIDSPDLARFDSDDKQGLLKVVDILQASLDENNLSALLGLAK